MGSYVRVTGMLYGVSAMVVGGAAPAMAQALPPNPFGNSPFNRTPSYLAGDMHNHTTCSDGSTSVQFMLNKSLGAYKLDWMTNSGHGGAYTRDCRFSQYEPGAPLDVNGNPRDTLWVETIGAAAIKGDPVFSGTIQAMWRWQSIEQYDYPANLKAAATYQRPVLEGLEQIVPGHEHGSTSIVANQYPAGGGGNADAVAQFEYLFDRADNDTSGGGGQGWTGKIPNPTGVGSGTAGHAKAVEGVRWMQANYPLTAYNIPTHVERAGMFNPDGAAGWNVEHFRDYNNAGPTVAFGFESMPGHQPEGTQNGGRGGYSPNAVGAGTFGGVGLYAGVIGNIWDALLGEGRNWFNYGSSDFHNRGAFGPNDSATTGDFWPGEFEKIYLPNTVGFGARGVVNNLRTGNSFSVMGDLIGPDYIFRICTPANICRKMGEVLVVAPGTPLTLQMRVVQPNAVNHSPYSFPNPILKFAGLPDQPINRPALDHIDLISGDVTGLVPPGSPNYTNPSNPSAKIAATFNALNWTATPVAAGTRYELSFDLGPATKDFYVRSRGTNLPAGIQYTTDAQGSPLLDTNVAKIPCADAACPIHLQTINGQKYVTYDVQSWSNVWFYGNPVFVRLSSHAPLAIENAQALATTLAAK